MKFLNSITQDLDDNSWEIDNRHLLKIQFAKANIARVTFLRDKVYELDRTWAIADSEKFDVKGRWKSKLPTTTPNSSIEFNLNKDSCGLEWSFRGQTMLRDRASNAFGCIRRGGWAHYTELEDSAEFYGLGEKAGALNHRGKSVVLKNLDAMGYDAENTDPLYKHFPFYIKRLNDGQRSFWLGVFYDNFATSHFNFGKEIDNYHGPYYSYQCEAGDLDYYLIFADSLSEVTESFASLTGPMILPPRWSLQYSGSSMHYTDQPNSQTLIKGFAKKCQEHQIPCGSFQLSSGYTSIGEKRYVFNWNTDKFPSPEKLAEELDGQGIRLAANIKPVLLTDHPMYSQAAEADLFIKDSETGDPESSQFWSGRGSHLDFTNPKTQDWWREQVQEQLLKKGIAATWNDNNEFEVWDSEARCNGFGEPLPIGLIRPIQSLLMMAASYEAQIEHSPNRRPWLISRCGMPGMQRFCQTWSGDNFTEWKTLKFNLYMALNLSLSGVFNIGHDIGGFSGPAPEPELFVRWLEHGIFYPRLTIHSWNEDGSVTEPWMYPEHTQIIAQLMQMREQLSDYLYSQVFHASENQQPILRPLFFDFESDPESFRHTDQFMFGPNLMIANQFRAQVNLRQVYLPDKNIKWYLYPTFEKFQGGENIELSTPLGESRFFIREGAVVPLGALLLVAPGAEGTDYSTTLYFDDGESLDYKTGSYLKVEILVKRAGEKIAIEFEREGSFQLSKQFEWKCLDENLKIEFVNDRIL